MSHFDAIRWSDCLLPALGGLRLQDSHARNIALGTSAAAYAQPEVTGGGGHTRRFRWETEFAPPPARRGSVAPDRQSVLPSAAHGGKRARYHNRRVVGSHFCRPTHWTKSRAAQAVLFSLSLRPQRIFLIELLTQCLTEWRPAWLTERLMSSLFFLQCDQVVVYSRPRRKIRNSELSKVNSNRALRLRRKIRSSERSTVD